MIWRILEITEEGVIDRGRWITPSDIYSLQIIDDGDGSENVTLKMNSRFFNFSAFIPIRLKCKMQANFPGVDFMRTALILSLQRERKIRRRLFTSSIKREFRHFHIIAVITEMNKKSVMHVQICSVAQ